MLNDKVYALVVIYHAHQPKAAEVGGSWQLLNFDVSTWLFLHFALLVRLLALGVLYVKKMYVIIVRVCGNQEAEPCRGLGRGFCLLGSIGP